MQIGNGITTLWHDNWHSFGRFSPMWGPRLAMKPMLAVMQLAVSGLVVHGGLGPQLSPLIVGL